MYSSPFTQVMLFVRGNANIANQDILDIVQKTLSYNEQLILSGENGKDVRAFLKKSLREICKEYGILIGLNTEKDLENWVKTVYSFAISGYDKETIKSW
jgi:hypothetical protein